MGFNDDLGENVADTTAVTPDSLLSRSLETFKVLKFKKFDGAPLDTISPLAYECFEQGCEALEAQTHDSKEWHQAKEVLRDVTRDLLAGAFFYSKNGDKDKMTEFARAYLDISLLDAFTGDAIELDPETLSMIAYIAASGGLQRQGIRQGYRLLQNLPCHRRQQAARACIHLHDSVVPSGPAVGPRHSNG